MHKDVFKQLEEEAKRLQMNFLPDQITTDFEKALVKPLQKTSMKIIASNDNS